MHACARACVRFESIFIINGASNASYQLKIPGNQITLCLRKALLVPYHLRAQSEHTTQRNSIEDNFQNSCQISNFRETARKSV